MLRWRVRSHPALYPAGEPAAADDDKKSYWEEFILLEGKRDSMCFDSVLCLPLEDSGDDARPYDN